ncbi:MAG: hypothetical protein WB660_30800 [Candidatus Sulfotelmatobacter sp.]
MGILTYTGSTTFNPVKVKITFNQSIEGKLHSMSGHAGSDDGVFVKTMFRGNSELASYSGAHFCVDDLKIQAISNVLIIECSDGQMNAPDELLVSINTVKKLPKTLSIAGIQRWEKD